jgi:pilus assembly protein CpaC
MMTTARSIAAAVLLAAAFPAAGHMAAQVPSPQERTSAAGSRIALTAGRSTILTTDFDVTRIAITNPAVADATVVEPREILIDGKAPGTVSLILWGGGRRVQYDLAVDAGVTALQQQFRTLFPGEDINVTVNEEATTLSGNVSNNAVMLKAGEIATKTSSKTKVLNLLQVPGGIGSQQVMLQVRFAEVNRNAVSELGVSFFTGASGYKNWIARETTGQFPSVQYGEIPGGTSTFSDFLNLFVFNTKYNVGALLKALQQRGYLQSLAEPNLIAYNGQEASFLAGGEVPIPVAQGGGAGAVSVQYKEFGIRLNFTPTIGGDVIRLRVRPEVSSLDFANGVSLSGFRIPALLTRRAETDVELRDGQSFAIAGLLDNISQDTRASVPLLSSLPIIGALFKTKALSQQRTELLVLITPHLVRPLDPDEVPPLPTDPQRFFRPTTEGAGGKLQGGGGTLDGPPVAAPPAPADGKKKKGSK